MSTKSKTANTKLSALLFALTLATSACLLFTYLNFWYFHLESALLSAVQEIVLIPCILCQLVILF